MEMVDAPRRPPGGAYAEVFWLAASLSRCPVLNMEVEERGSSLMRLMEGAMAHP